jgi:hypothetical protein
LGGRSKGYPEYKITFEKEKSKINKDNILQLIDKSFKDAGNDDWVCYVDKDLDEAKVEYVIDNYLTEDTWYITTVCLDDIWYDIYLSNEHLKGANRF